MNPNNLVCRTCLGIISEGKVAHNIDDENGLIRNVRNIREMIMFCVPEMDTYISISPVVCESCVGILVSVYNFKIRCLRVENAIRSYIQANNVMDGSVVNLNNVVRQQIVEALKQKNWPPDLIKEYVEKHLCTPNTTANRPNVAPELFKAMSNKFDAPRLLSNSPRPAGAAGLNLFDPPPFANSTFNLAPTAAINNCSPPLYPPSPPPYEHNFRAPAPPRPPGGRYLSVSKNLMPPRPELSPVLQQQIRDISRLNTPPFNPVALGPNLHLAASSASVSQSVVPPSCPQPEALVANIGEYQSAFLHSLQLTSAANGGREEAILMKKKQRLKRPRKAKQNPVGSQNFIPPLFGSGNNSTARTATACSDGDSLCSVSRTLSPTTGLMRENVEQVAPKETGLRRVRKISSAQSKENNRDKNALDQDEIIILDDDTDMVTEKVGGGEKLIINFDENVRDGDVMDSGSQSTPKTNKPQSDAAKTQNFAKKVYVKLPMIDQETLKRKLTPEDLIDEIQSKRRKLVVKVSSVLPYLHKNKRLVVNVRRDRFFSCLFCKCWFSSVKQEKKHYLSNHKVCARCNFKCNWAAAMTQHINIKHPLDLQEALKKCEKDKSDFHCYLCNFTGLSDFDLRDHRLRIHVKCDVTGMYKCPYLTCDKELAIAYEMAKHIEKEHDKIRQTICPLCNYRSQTPGLLKKHIETHSLAKIKCTLCTFGCKTAFSLKRHMKKYHPDVENLNTTGMVYSTDLNEEEQENYNEDYRITLDSLQSPTTKTLQKTSENNSRIGSGDILNPDGYEFTLPSLSEMLCVQTFSEEPSDQEGDCTIVSEDVSKPRRKTRTKFTKKKNKPQESSPVDDPEDCMIVTQEILTVDVSDDEDEQPSESKKRKGSDDGSEESENTESSSEVIEIEDQNDNEDCIVVADVPAESSAEKSSEDASDMTDLRLPDDSETDTCSEISPESKKKSPQEAGSGSETEASSELSASDVLSRKTTSGNEAGSEKSVADSEEFVTENIQVGSLDEVQKNDARDQTAGEKGENTDAQKILLTDSSKNQQEGDISSQEKPDSENETVNQERNFDQSISTTSEKSKETNKLVAKSVSEVENISKTNETDRSSEKSDQILGSIDKGSENLDNPDQVNKDLEDLLNKRFNDSSKSSEAEKSQSQKKLIVPDITCPESVLIESSDESNDCTFISETIEPESTDHQVDSKTAQKELSNEENASEASNTSDKEDNLAESRENLETHVEMSEKGDALEIDKPNNELGESSKAFEEESSENPNCDKNDNEKNISENKNSVSVEPNPASEDNVIDADTESENSGLTKENINIEINKETNNEKLLLDDSEILSTDSEMESENVEKTSDIEQNISDILNTDSETENIEDSKISHKNTDTEKNITEISKSQNIESSDIASAQKITDAELVEDKIREKVSEVLAVDFGLERNVTAQKNSDDSETIKMTNVNTSETLIVESESDNMMTQKVSKTGSDLEIEKEKLQDNVNSDSNVDSDTVECAEKKLLNILEVTKNIVDNSCASKEIKFAYSDPSVFENVLKNVNTVSGDSESRQKLLESNKEDAKSTIINEHTANVSVATGSEQPSEVVSSQNIQERPKKIAEDSGASKGGDGAKCSDERDDNVAEFACSDPSVSEKVLKNDDSFSEESESCKISKKEESASSMVVDEDAIENCVLSDTVGTEQSSENV